MMFRLTIKNDKFLIYSCNDRKIGKFQNFHFKSFDYINYGGDNAFTSGIKLFKYYKKDFN